VEGETKDARGYLAAYIQMPPRRFPPPWTAEVNAKLFHRA
jgi:hypothetical protein